jgi:hypothetical protein
MINNFFERIIIYKLYKIYEIYYIKNNKILLYIYKGFWGFGEIGRAHV